MPAEDIIQNLDFINWMVVTALATGTLAAVVAARFLTAATRGYLAFTAFSAAAFAFLAGVGDAGLPLIANRLTVPYDAHWDQVRNFGHQMLMISALTLGVAILRGRQERAIAAFGVVSAGLVLVAGAFSYGGDGAGIATLLVQLVVLAAALGGVWAAMILGHWYLVTPKLPEAPLVRVARWLAIVLAAQVALFVIWTALGAGPAGAPMFAALVGPWALFVWLRLLVGLVFPLVVSWAAVQTARSRSMESATGLLYINVGTIAAGTILAAGLYFGAGLLV